MHLYQKSALTAWLGAIAANAIEFFETFAIFNARERWSNRHRPMNAYVRPEQSGLSRASVESLADGIARQLAFEPAGDLSEVVARLGGRIEFGPLGAASETDGSIRIEQSGSFVISLAAHTGRKRDRFTVAHELGHYVLHYLWPKRKGVPALAVEATRCGSGRVEWEANWFAAALLMPSAAFRSAFAENCGDLVAVAEQFDVSLEAARVRAQVLGLSQPTHAPSI